MLTDTSPAEDPLPKGGAISFLRPHRTKRRPTVGPTKRRRAVSPEPLRRLLFRHVRPGQLAYDARRLLILVPLMLRNLFTKTSITDPDSGVVVSMTTRRVRARTTFFAIESIARGLQKPCRVILWVDDLSLFSALPWSLRRLAKRGLEIKMCDNFGPHTKYFPYVMTNEELQQPLVTADDDFLYPKDWLLGLVTAFHDHPSDVHCYTAQVINMDRTGQIAPYVSWQYSKSQCPSILNFANGSSGVLYPPAVLRALKTEGSGFMDCCPTADDIWLHRTTIRTGARVQQVCPSSPSFYMIPATQRHNLVSLNIEGGQNDVQILATYEHKDLVLLYDAHSKLL